MANKTENKPAISRPVMLAAAAGIIGIIVLANQGGDTAVAPPKKAAKKSSTQSADSLYLPVDYTVNFPSLNAPIKNVFRPLIGKLVDPTNPVNMKSGIPTFLTGGESNWTFTGTAEDGGVVLALVENSTRGDSAFLKVGDSWKTSTVAGIEGDHLLLKGPDGEVNSILMEADVQAMIAQNMANKADLNPTSAVAPVRPDLSGPIGMDAGVSDPNAVSVQPDSTDANPRSRRGGNRRRRGGN